MWLHFTKLSFDWVYFEVVVYYQLSLKWQRLATSGHWTEVTALKEFKKMLIKMTSFISRSTENREYIKEIRHRIYIEEDSPGSWHVFTSCCSVGQHRMGVSHLSFVPVKVRKLCKSSCTENPSISSVFQPKTLLQVHPFFLTLPVLSSSSLVIFSSLTKTWVNPEEEYQDFTVINGIIIIISLTSSCSCNYFFICLFWGVDSGNKTTII